MSEFQKAIDNDALGNKPLYLTLTTAAPTYQMKPGDVSVIAISSATDDVAIITLPPVSQCTGKIYYIKAPTGAAGGDISLYVKETGAELTTNGDMDADNDYLVLFSTGIAWLTLVDGVA